MVCLIEDGVIESIHIDELKFLIEFLKLQNNGDKNSDKITSVLMNLTFDEEQKNYVVSLCYELALLKPLVSIFVSNIESPDYFSCLNILMSHLDNALQSKKEQEAEIIMKQILELVKNALKRVISSKRELKLQHLTNE